jgi:Short C-terminal domain
MIKSRVLLLVLILSILVGCHSTGIVQTSPDTYKVSQKSAGGIFTDTAKLRDEVIQEANAFAASRGKIAVPIASHSEHPLVGGLPSFEYEFKLADKSPSEPVATEKHGDLYVELLKLDDLRKKGLITDAEFEAQKQKLLNQTK